MDVILFHCVACTLSAAVAAASAAFCARTCQWIVCA
jgi:hypothetical protein